MTGARAAELVDNNTILVVVDVNRPSITDAPELLRLVKTIVVLDHHRQSSEIIDNAVLSYVCLLYTSNFELPGLMQDDYLIVLSNNFCFT